MLNGTHGPAYTRRQLLNSELFLSEDQVHITWKHCLQAIALPVFH